MVLCFEAAHRSMDTNAEIASCSEQVVTANVKQAECQSQERDALCVVGLVRSLKKFATTRHLLTLTFSLFNIGTYNLFPA